MLKPYMGYSREMGSCEGAVLIWANNIKEAKRIGWPVLSNFIVDEFTDMAVNYIKDGDYLFEQMPAWSKAKLNGDEPHVVDSPPSCKACEKWGVGIFDENGNCQNCAEEIEDNKRLEKEHPEWFEKIEGGKKYE